MNCKWRIRCRCCENTIYIHVYIYQRVARGLYMYCYVPGVTRKELGNQNLVFEKSAKSTFKI